MHEPLVIDTCSLNRDFLNWLRKYRGDKILPAVAYCEFAYHMVSNKHKSISLVNHILNKADITVQDFTRKHGICIADNCQNIPELDFKEQWRDFMIASHAHIAPYILVTDNIKHFSFLGDRVIEPDKLMRQRRYRN